MDKIPMTAEGYAALEADLKHCREVERPRIIEQIADARGADDLSENVEYHAATELQSLNEARIAELEDKLARAEVIDTSKLSGKNDHLRRDGHPFSTRKRKRNPCGKSWASPRRTRRGEKLVRSPLARALIGKKKGAEVEVAAPGGAKDYKVLTVEWT